MMENALPVRTSLSAKPESRDAERRVMQGHPLFSSLLSRMTPQDAAHVHGQDTSARSKVGSAKGEKDSTKRKDSVAERSGNGVDVSPLTTPAMWTTEPWLTSLPEAGIIRESHTSSKEVRKDTPDAMQGITPGIAVTGHLRTISSAASTDTASDVSLVRNVPTAHKDAARIADHGNLGVVPNTSDRTVTPATAELPAVHVDRRAELRKTSDTIVTSAVNASSGPAIVDVAKATPPSLGEVQLVAKASVNRPVVSAVQTPAIKPAADGAPLPVQGLLESMRDHVVKSDMRVAGILKEHIQGPHAAVSVPVRTMVAALAKGPIHIAAVSQNIVQQRWAVKPPDTHVVATVATNSMPASLRDAVTSPNRKAPQSVLAVRQDVNNGVVAGRPVPMTSPPVTSKAPARGGMDRGSGFLAQGTVDATVTAVQSSFRDAASQGGLDAHSSHTQKDQVAISESMRSDQKVMQASTTAGIPSVMQGIGSAPVTAAASVPSSSQTSLPTWQLSQWATNAAQWIANQSARATLQTASSLEVQLAPERLGRVRVTVSLSDSGQLFVQLQAGLHTTRDLMQHSVQDLANLLESQGFTGVQVGVDSGRQQAQTWDHPTLPAKNPEIVMQAVPHGAPRIAFDSVSLHDGFVAQG